MLTDCVNLFCTHITGQFLVVLHQVLVLLVDSQHFADTIGGCLSLSRNRVMSSAHSDWIKTLCHRVHSLCLKPSENIHCVDIFKTKCCKLKSLKK